VKKATYKTNTHFKRSRGDHLLGLGQRKKGWEMREQRTKYGPGRTSRGGKKKVLCIQGGGCPCLLEDSENSREWEKAKGVNRRRKKGMKKRDG